MELQYDVHMYTYTAKCVGTYDVRNCSTEYLCCGQHTEEARLQLPHLPHSEDFGPTLAFAHLGGILAKVSL